MDTPVTVLHLAPHYGGGVGTVVRALIEGSQASGLYRHRIACFEYLNPQMQDWAGQRGILTHGQLGQEEQAVELATLVNQSDLVHLHWWHHPLLNAWMHRSDPPRFRCALWSHVNGHHPPQNFPSGLVQYADQLVLATPWSLEAPALLAQPGLSSTMVIQSSAGIPVMPPRPAGNTGPLRIGYVGTVDPAKMHPDFVSLCLEADLPDAQFMVVGGPSHAALQAEIDARGVSRQFQILGPRNDVPSLMANFDIFAYPLAAAHYGTGEQVLIEAMAAGAVPVVLDTGCERWIVEHGHTGLVCADAAEFTAALRHLAKDTPLRQRLAKQAVASVAGRYPIEKTVATWHDIYDRLMEAPKRSHCLPGKVHSPCDLLLAAAQNTPLAGIYQDCLAGKPVAADRLSQLPAACFAATRGSVWHYQAFFPDDPELRRLCQGLYRSQPSTCKDNR